MKKSIKWFIFIILLCIFSVLSFFVITKNDIYLDVVVYKTISKIINESVTPYIIKITTLTSTPVVIVVTLFTFLLFKNKKYGIYMSLNLIIITIFQFLLKFMFSRNRPLGINLIDETGYSFPSGHSLTSAAFYGFIIYLIYISSIKLKSKILFISFFTILIFMIGLSRIYLGVHYATDVIGGFVFSIMYLIVYTSIINKKISL